MPVYLRQWCRVFYGKVGQLPIYFKLRYSITNICADLCLVVSPLVTQPFYMKFCNGVIENLQNEFVMNVGYFITEACITNSITKVFIINRLRAIWPKENIIRIKSTVIIS